MNVDRACDAVLDRRSSVKAPRFEARLHGEPGVAAAVELHRDVAASLRRTMRVPDLSELFARIDAAAEQMRAGGRAAVDGSVRWVAAAASLLFLCIAMCASTLVTAPPAPVEDGHERTDQRRWRVHLVEAVGLSLATASAVVASGAGLGRGSSRRKVRGGGSLAGVGGCGPVLAEEEPGLEEPGLQAPATFVMVGSGAGSGAVGSGGSRRARRAGPASPPAARRRDAAQARGAGHRGRAMRRGSAVRGGVARAAA